MKAILEFDLNEQSDKYNHLRCIKSIDMAYVLFEISNNLKKKCESKINIEADETVQNDISTGIDIVFDKIYELMDEYKINIEELLD